MKDDRSMKTLVEDLTEAVILREKIRMKFSDAEASGFALGYIESFLVQTIQDEAPKAIRNRIMQRLIDRLEVVSMQVDEAQNPSL
jgi:hypothetical protein